MMHVSRHNVGAMLWVLSLQYYITQLVVASAWNAPYSWPNNTISDLANTVCGPYGDRIVCSPLHAYMNGSFVLLGVTMIIGAWLLGSYYAQSRMVRLGMICMAISGVGTILVGLFPENTVASMHVLGAGLAFLIGNIGVLLLCVVLPTLPVWLRIIGAGAAAIALFSLGLFMTGQYLGLGIGGLERIVGYPQSVWMIVVGIVLLVQRDR